MSGCFAYFSDDRGSTWQRSKGSIMVWPLPGERSLGGFGGTAEPVVTELKDGSILMLLRTKVGRFFSGPLGTTAERIGMRRAPPPSPAATSPATWTGCATPASYW